MKYTVLVALAGTFYYLFEEGIARTATLILVIVVIIVSLIASRIQKRRLLRKKAVKELSPSDEK